jgi:hypothetical protein
MSPGDAKRLVTKLGVGLRSTDLRVTIQSANGKSRLPYPVFVYPEPPEVLNTKGNAKSGLLLLKLSDDGIQSRPFKASQATKQAPPAAAKRALEPPRKTLAERENFHLYLLVGQSNMAGRGTIEGIDLKIHPRVLCLDDRGRWVVALDPLHTDKPKAAGVGLGTSFGKVMAEKTPGAVIGLIPCAVGGTSINQWAKGAPPTGHWGKLYENAIRRAKIAQRDGVLKGILWHQGESNCSTSGIAAYQKNLTALVANFRADLESPDAPFVAGTLGVWDPQKHARRQAFNDNLASLPDWFSKAALVDAKGLPHRGDNTHFASKALRELGRRYATALDSLQ